jgi:hypothetical protein
MTSTMTCSATATTMDHTGIAAIAAPTSCACRTHSTAMTPSMATGTAI